GVGHRYDRPKSINVVGIEIAFGCRRDTLGVRTSVDGMLLLPTDSEITRLELHCDSEPFVDGVSQRKGPPRNHIPQRGESGTKNDKLRCSEGAIASLLLLEAVARSCHPPEDLW